jgi:hypothetical protein
MNITPHNFQTKAQTYISDPSSLLTLNLRRPIRCLNGLHRIQAAKDYLDRNDQWWVVRLYDGMDRVVP